MLAAGEGRAHLTRTLDHVRGVSVVGNGHGDAALRIEHGDGETLLTLLPE